MSLLLFLSMLAVAAVPGPTDETSPAPPAVAAVLAPLPTTDELAGWSVLDYNAYVVDNQFAVMREIDHSLKAFVAAAPSEEAYEAFRRQVRESAHAGLTNARMLAPWKGDASFRDAIVLGYTVLLRVFDEDLPAMWAMTTKPEVRNADLAALEQLQRRIEEESAKTDQAVRDAQAAFARKHGFVLLKSDDVPVATLPPEFTAPGIPPADSVLSGNLHAGFALRYHNVLVDREVRIVDAANGFMGATSGDAEALERVRKEALVTIRAELAATRATEDWQGDDSLRLGLVTAGEQIERLLADDFATYTRLRQKAQLSQAEVDRLNAIAEASGPALQGAIDGFTAAQDAFHARWGVAAYDAWLREQGKIP